ncbi:MAG: restriction endonuclease, partial [Candidatus Izemoplasmatales bacterium]
QYSLDLIVKYIERKLKGYPLQSLIAGILQAKGYHTFVPGEGADEGVDILAGKGELGFLDPLICVQVKSTDSPVDRATLDQLIGTMNNFNANNGILVSWSGFKHSVEKVRAKQFFKVRLWNQIDVIKELFENYNNLSEEIKNMVPLKRIWILTNNDL